MPIYEYQCEACSGRFDVLTSFADRDRAQVCPACESRKTRVLVSTFASLGGADEAPADFGSMAGGGGCACGGSCSCGGHN
jgi:putative FmdB family regulatory protein